jgi:RNA polymerase sigma-70 factor, ECF subfamily
MPSSEPPDADLVARVATGDREAFAMLFRRRQRDVYRFALHMTALPSVAEDVTQEVFLTLMRDASRYDAARATVVAWLCGIARNQVRRRFERDRMLQPMGMLDQDDLDEGVDPALVTSDRDVLADLTAAEQIDALRQAVLTLPVAYREVVVLCDLQELSYADAAAVIGCALGTVRSRLHRARALLTSKMAHEKDVGYVARTFRTSRKFA